MKNRISSDFESCLVLPPPQCEACMELTACDEQDVNEIVDDRRCAEGTKQLILFKKLTAFTLAEILLSLSIIGIVAAIALPSLLGNVHERAFETQKKALYTRFSQAIPLLPSLNGYGQLEGTLSEGTKGQEGYVPQNVTVDTAAESFVRDGLSKVMKITNICDSEHLTDCGLPDKINPLSGTNQLELSNMKSLIQFNPRMINAQNTGSSATFEQLDTKAAAFETVNGESILVYYNPNCEPDLNEHEKPLTYMWSQPKMCANFIYDMNGKKGPNTVGKDIGFISALYSTDPVVVSPNLYVSLLPNKMLQLDALQKCKEIYGDAKIPTIDEAKSIFYNMRLLGIAGSALATSTLYNAGWAWQISSNEGRYGLSERKTAELYTTCLKK